MFRLVFNSFVVAGLWCAACGPVSAPDATPSAVITDTPSDLTLTPTVKLAPSPTTPIQLSTPTSPVPTVTSSPEPELSMTDYWLRVTQVVDQLIAMTEPRVVESSESPDNRWRIDIVVRDCTKVDSRESADENALEQLMLVDVQHSREFVVAGQLQYCGGLGAFGFGGLRWSANSRYFYFTSAKNGVPDGVCWYWEQPVDQLDIQSREVTTLGGGPTSPDGSRIAVWQEDALVIWDYELGEVFRDRAMVRGSFVGPKAWAPDSKQLVYVQNTMDCFPFGESTLVIVDFGDGTQRELLRSSEPSIVFVEWVEQDLLVLVDSMGEHWLLTPSTGGLSAKP